LPKENQNRKEFKAIYEGKKEFKEIYEKMGRAVAQPSQPVGPPLPI